ncbi:MAG TPA: hemerythrin domain-containing protein [Allosphingosinicella sp.]|nr:hemerythrin domain-containing protein [Allosphingosinicella sp.]
MATRTESRQSKSGSEQGAFSWSGDHKGVIAGAALAGAAIGIAANVGRKLFVQYSSGTAGDWFDALKAEHQAALALFDRIEATDDGQTMLRGHLLAKLKHALDRHSAEEENVVYPALREANLAHDADALNSEHFYVKTYLYELETMPKDSPDWLARIRDFHSMIHEHMRMEEEEVFPSFRAIMSAEQNARLTAMMNREGFAAA